MAQAARQILKRGGPDTRDVPPARAAKKKVVQILDAAGRLFLSRDYDAVTMDMVTQVSGISKATLYVYFNSKEDLFLAVVTDEFSRMTDVIWTPSLHDVDVETVLKQIARNFSDVFLTPQAMALRRAVVSVIPRFPHLGQAIFDAGPKLLTDRVARFLSEADAAGILAIPDPQQAATLFLSIIRFDLDIRGIFGLKLPTKPEIEALTNEGVAIFLLRYSGDRP